MNPEMQAYLSHIPLFIFFVLLGTVVNIMRSRKKWTKSRIRSEIISSIWISSVLVLILDNFFEWKVTAYYGIGSLAGFLNSKLIDYVGEDLMEVLFRKLLDSPYSGSSNDDNNNYTEGIDPEEDSPEERH